MNRKLLLLSLGAGACLLAADAGANSFTFNTPLGSSTSGGAVNASATFVTSTDTVTITLANLLANPKDVAQLISDINFKLSSGQTAGTLASSSGTQITVNNNGTWTTGTTGLTGWGVDQGTLHLTALGYGGPEMLIIGPDNGSGLYSKANGSIAGNNAHNPFLASGATFTLYVPGVNVDSSVLDVVFSFGTTPGIDVPASVPDGGTTVVMLGAALSGLAMIRRKLS